MQTKVNTHLQKRARHGWRASALTCSDLLQYMENKHSAFVVFTPGNTVTAQVLWHNHKKQIGTHALKRMSRPYIHSGEKTYFTTTLCTEPSLMRTILTPFSGACSLRPSSE